LLTKAPLTVAATNAFPIIALLSAARPTLHKRTRNAHGPFLSPPPAMKIIPLAAGIATGALLVRERQRRQAAERLAAAVLETLLRAIDANDGETGGHVRRVARYALLLAEAADLDENDQKNVERIALFHDVGKIDEALFDIIHDTSDLTEQEREAVRTHPKRGADVLAPVAAFYPELADGVLSHHERWDGGGYPRGLRGESIPFAARIVTIADSFDAMTYARRYHTARSAEEASEKLMAGRGTQFDPDLVDLFLSPPVFKEALSVLHEDRGPRRRGTPQTPPRETTLPKLSFRWRTTTPSPQPQDRGPRR
jgi:HD-GYP domain-containing protein (c-di-GMP phosphodiesterase class II)